MDSWIVSNWGCYAKCHNEVLGCVFWPTNVFVRCLPRMELLGQDSRGLLCSRCYEIALQSVCTSCVCELWLLQVLGMVSLTVAAAKGPLGVQPVLSWFSFSFRLLRLSTSSLIYWPSGHTCLWYACSRFSHWVFCLFLNDLQDFFVLWIWGLCQKNVLQMLPLWLAFSPSERCPFQWELFSVLFKKPLPIQRPWR